MPSAAEDARLRAAIEQKGLKFQIKAGNAKWQCTILDRATHERQKATRTGSASSISSTESSSSSAKSTY
ncbi:hypothetical protein N656DRAFT_800462 [Canariomyces notabilis]|uniref:Uncharacterized protein n=1 Tax=Canariomyces notabilis TaxID=2074819 RepID=A0AAN6QNW8_9PEZI|nr:hypothetical protein N656DRAFT_800462 [Canariomyces arenarius]